MSYFANRHRQKHYLPAVLWQVIIIDPKLLDQFSNITAFVDFAEAVDLRNCTNIKKEEEECQCEQKQLLFSNKTNTFHVFGPWRSM